MALDMTRFPQQLAAPLVISDSYRKFWENSVLSAAAANYQKILSAAFTVNDTEENEVLNDLTNFVKQVALDLATQWTTHKDTVQSDDGLFSLLEVDLAASDQKDAGGSIEYTHDNISGVVYILAKLGLWPAVSNDMSAQGYQVLSNAITFGSLTADATNRGSLTVTAMAALQHILRGKSGGTAIFTVEDESCSAPKIKVQVKLNQALPDGTLLLDGDDDLQPEKSFEEGNLGFTATTLTRGGLAAPTESGDDGNIFSASSISAPAEGDMAGGVLCVRVVRQGSAPIWLIEFYSNSARTSAFKVGSTTLDGTVGTAAIDITLKNQTRFQSTFDKAAANTKCPGTGNEDNDITFDIKTPRIGDRWTCTITSDQAGKFGTKIAEFGPISLPSGPAAPGSAATAALAGAGAGNVTNGTHSWKYTFVSPYGESEGSGTSNVLNVANNAVDGKVNLTGVIAGPGGTTARKIYRRVAGDTGLWKFVGTIADNVTTTFQDNIADGSLGANAKITFTDSLAASISV